MRLINADDVVKYCCSSYGFCAHDCEKYGFAKSVDKIPTAFDFEMCLVEGCEHVVGDDEIMILGEMEDE